MTKNAAKISKFEIFFIILESLFEKRNTYSNIFLGLKRKEIKLLKLGKVKIKGL